MTTSWSLWAYPTGGLVPPVYRVQPVSCMFMSPNPLSTSSDEYAYGSFFLAPSEVLLARAPSPDEAEGGGISSSCPCRGVVG